MYFIKNKSILFDILKQNFILWLEKLTNSSLTPTINKGKE